MSGRETLQAFRDTAAEIRRLDRELEEARSTAARVTTSYSLAGGRGGGDGRRTESAALRLEALEAEQLQHLEELVALRYAVERVLERLPTERDRIMFRLSYVDGRTWVEISEIMGLCYARVCKLHGKLLAALDDHEGGVILNREILRTHQPKHRKD